MYRHDDPHEVSDKIRLSWFNLQKNIDRQLDWCWWNSCHSNIKYLIVNQLQTDLWNQLHWNLSRRFTPHT